MPIPARGHPWAPFFLFLASRVADQGRTSFWSFSYSVGGRALHWWGGCVLAPVLCCQIHYRHMVAQKLGRVVKQSMCERGAWAWGGLGCLCYSAVIHFFFLMDKRVGPGWGLIDNNKTNASVRESRAVCCACFR
jgi:hypothetical protein